ncbi:MAG: phage tail tip lysozyme [Solirubrobacteraceae bacterium]
MRSAAAAVAVIVLGVPLTILLLLEPASNCGSPSSPVSAPAPGTQTAGQVVRYLESQGFTPFGAAGIVGNLQQESTSAIDPTLSDGAGGGGIAQWKASWYAQMASWAIGHGLSPTSLAGQLAYLAFDVRASYPQLVSELNSASSPQEAATMFETTYELCSGYVAYMVVIPGSLCNDPARRTYAVQAYAAAGGQSGAAVPVSLGSGGGTCCPTGSPSSTASGQLVSLPLPANEMLPGSWSYDAGIDIPAPAGTPEYAVGPGVIVKEGLAGFGPNAPVLNVTGGPLAGKSFYYGHAGPDTVPVGTQVQAGQQISEVGAGIVGISTGPHIEFGLYPAAGGAAVAPILQQLMAAGSSTAPSGTAMPVSLSVGGTCAQPVSFTGKDPIPGFTPGRDDSGVDACAQLGMPIYAPATSVLIEVLQNWYQGQPLMLFQFVPPLSGTYQGDEYWYVAEQIAPATQTPGTVFQAGQPVATFAPSGTCIEIGWGSTSTSMRALAPQYANPAAGQLTPVGETFKQYFGIPWVGQSP